MGVPYARPIVGAATTISVTPEPAAADAAPRLAPARVRSLLTPAAIAVTLLPLAVLAVHMLRIDVVLTADLATTEMRTRDVVAHAPDLGPYSRDGWFHPGPALYYALAGPYRLFGGDSAALLVAAIAVNAASLATMMGLARRRGGTGLMLATAIGCAVLMHALGPTFLASPWNVYITVLPYGALLFLLWAMVCGERWALPGAVVATTFVIQTHVGFLALALPLLVAAVGVTIGQAVVVARRRRRAAEHQESDDDPSVATAVDGTATNGATGNGAADHEAADPAAADPTATSGDPAGMQRFAWARRGFLLPALVAVAVGVLAWLPPAVQQVRNVQGNGDRVWEWFRDGGEEARTLLEGWRIVADQYRWLPEWITGQRTLALLGEPAAIYESVVPVLLLLVLPAVVVLWRLRGGPGRALAATWFVASAVAVFATARTIGLLYAYRLHWAWVLGMVGGVLVLWAAWTVAAAWREWARRAAAGVALATLVGLGVANTVAATRADLPEATYGELTAGLLADTEAGLAARPGDDPVLVQLGSFGAIGISLGLTNELERAGVDVVTDAVGAGGHRVWQEGQPVRAALVVAIDDEIVTLSRMPGHQMIALTGDADMAELEADAARRQEVSDAVATGTLTPEELVAAAAQTISPLSSAAVFLVDPVPAA